MVQMKIFMTTASDPGLGLRSEGVAISGTNTYYSEPWSGKGADGASLHLDWTGTPAGNVQLWYSDKENPVRTSDADWVQDTGFGTAGDLALGGAAGKYNTSVGNAKARWKRCKVVMSSSSGTIKGNVSVPRNQ